MFDIMGKPADSDDFCDIARYRGWLSYYDMIIGMNSCGFCYTKTANVFLCLFIPVKDKIIIRWSCNWYYILSKILKLTIIYFFLWTKYKILSDNIEKLSFFFCLIQKNTYLCSGFPFVGAIDGLCNKSLS